MRNNPPFFEPVIRAMRLTVVCCVVLLACAAMMLAASNGAPWWESEAATTTRVIESLEPISNPWKAPDIRSLKSGPYGDTVMYGKALIESTAYYLGPSGILGARSNGMNCTHCHPDAGTKLFGNNFSMVAGTYPKFRPRSGTVETIEKRINDCFERSMNGQPLDHQSHEMRAMKAYLLWLGRNNKQKEGSGVIELSFLDRAADPQRGYLVYQEHCQTCHGLHGEGKQTDQGVGYQYPPLWGPNSFNKGAGLYRLTRMAGYIKGNMPQGATYTEPLLTNEEAWDVAAYVIAMYRPGKDISHDWPDIADKPIDHPFGPYADPFPEDQHKFGPLEPIREYYATHHVHDISTQQVTRNNP